MASSSSQPTSWPDSAPNQTEDKVFSIVCRHKKLCWSLHEGWGQGFAPTWFWRTPALTDEELKAGPCEALSRHLPETANEYVFGDGKSPTRQSAERKGFERQTPKIRVYIVPSNKEQARKVASMWTEVPSIVYMMQGQDFFTKEQGRTANADIDKLAVLYGATQMCGNPALVFDGDTALTYTAADCQGNIMGSGISLGLTAKLASLSKVTGALPRIEAKEAMNLVTRAQKGETMSQFASDTKNAILVSSLGEIAYGSKEIIKGWLDKVGSATADGEEKPAPTIEQPKSGGFIVKGGVPDKSNGTNSGRTIAVTGEDCEILSMLLQPDHSHVVEASSSQGVAGAAGYKIRKIKNLAHYAIQSVLEQQSKLKKKKTTTSEAPWELSIIGQRVAKKFDVPDVDGDFVFRGTVSSLISGKDQSQNVFRILYDDDDSEEIDSEELYTSLMLYTQVGEKNPEDSQKESSKKAAQELAAKMQETLSQQQAAPPAKPPQETLSINEKENVAKPPQQKPSEPPPEKPLSDSASQNADSNKRPSDVMGEPQAKKARIAVDSTTDPYSFKNRRIAKKFGQLIFFGTVTNYEECSSDEEEEGGLWHIEYDDGDSEEFDKNDMEIALNLREERKNDDPEGTSGP